MFEVLFFFVKDLVKAETLGFAGTVAAGLIALMLRIQKHSRDESAKALALMHATVDAQGAQLNAAKEDLRASKAACEAMRVERDKLQEEVTRLTLLLTEQQDEGLHGHF